MVEMLGVLAIIGVLTVGGIAGFQKAMTKYKLNVMTEQFRLLIFYLLEHENEINKEPHGTVVPLLEALGVVPDSDNDVVEDVFNNTYSIFNYRIPQTPSIGWTQVRLDMKKNPSSFEICQAHYKIAKELSKYLYFIEIIIYGEGRYSNAFGDMYCYQNRTCLKDMSLTDIAKACEYCNRIDLPGQECIIMYYLYPFDKIATN